MHERRTSPRRRVEIDIEERTDGATYFQRSTDISTTGVLLASTLPHPPGTRVFLSLRLPDAGEPVTIEGTVVARSADELGMAVSFATPISLDLRAERATSAHERSSKTLS